MEVGSKYYDNYLVHVLKWSKPQEEIMPSHTGNTDKSCRKYIPEGLKLLLQFWEDNKRDIFCGFYYMYITGCYVMTSLNV